MSCRWCNRPLEYRVLRILHKNIEALCCHCLALLIRNNLRYCRAGHVTVERCFECNEYMCSNFQRISKIKNNGKYDEVRTLLHKRLTDTSYDNKKYIKTLNDSILTEKSKFLETRIYNSKLNVFFATLDLLKKLMRER